MQNPVRGFLNGTMALASTAGTAFMWQHCAGTPHSPALLAFALSLVALYTASSLYHSVPWSPLWKQRMQRVDHSMIYVLVAGTYTPFASVLLDGFAQWLALGAVWGIAAGGILQKVFVPGIGTWFSVTMQNVQGWLALPLVVPLTRQLPTRALILTLLGGAFYTVGMVLFVTKRPRLWPHVFSYHELFHVLVVAGSLSHYFVMISYLARAAGG